MKRFFYAMITTGRPALNGLRNWKTGERSHFCKVRVFTSQTERDAWVEDQPYSYSLHADWQPTTKPAIRRALCGMTKTQFNQFMLDLEDSVND